MQTDPNSNLQIKHTDHALIHEIEIETEAKAPNIFLSTSSENMPFSEDMQSFVDGSTDDPAIHITGLFSLSAIAQVNLIHTDNSEEILNGLANRTKSFDLVQKQQNDEIIGDVIS